MSEIELLTRIEQKINIFLEESMLQQARLKERIDVFEDAVAGDNGYNKNQEETAKFYLGRLLEIYERNSLDLSDLFFAIADYCHDRGLEELDTNCQELASDSCGIKVLNVWGKTAS
ncbi:hypothetical protein [Trichormus sp. NMC-1]|uniref:hypothetical protein n=1 Tax=Trichormus sp. NMC-1 TaxID=1853259 RepID=UPI00191C474A|nr:hypothetical protein [Trichormus sp. NMC-1]